ncbi:MAG: hypothetical protein V8R14_09335 [Clostridia bacterium]
MRQVIAADIFLFGDRGKAELVRVVAVNEADDPADTLDLNGVP